MTHTDFELTILQANRIKLKEIMEQLSDKQLLHIPAGFNNNILWHIGHCVVSQQRLIYMRSGLPMHVSDDYANNFKIGSSPKNWIATPNIQEVNDSLLNTVEQLRADLNAGIFKTYDVQKASMGFVLSNHLEALSYANFHEAEHTGNVKYMMKIMA